MKKTVAAISALAFMASSALADEAPKIKARLDKLKGTTYVLVISYVPHEITSISCEGYDLVGTNSWNHQNDLTIPAADNGTVAAVAVIDGDHYEGYCAKEGSLVAHTDYGDIVGHLDAGPGAWKNSTRLIFNKQ